MGGGGGRGFNIAAQSEIVKNPVDFIIKCLALKYLAKISERNINPLLYNGYCLSKLLEISGSYLWFTSKKRWVYFYRN